MFKLNEKYEIKTSILKCVFIRYSSSEISTEITATSQTYFKTPRGACVISLFNSYFDINFDVLLAATNIRYVDNSDLRLVILEPIAFSSNSKLTRSSGKHLEEISHAHFVL